MTSNKEEYLKIIYANGGEKEPVSNKLIAEKLGVAPSSVTEMLSKLKTQGFIEIQPYKGAILTEDGMVACMNVIRNCCLWEVFLVQHLGYSWREAHEEAHLLEHTSSTLLMDRLEDFLGYPLTCPHGSPIPQKNKLSPQVNLVSLTELRKGEKGISRRVSENVELLDYLQRMGFRLNEEVTIIEVSDYEGPILFLQGEESKRISFKAGREVYVEIVKE